VHTVLLVTLGPVQDFIASARRCQDLWFGSWLLSDLSREVARTLARECGQTDSLDAVIFPGCKSFSALDATHEERRGQIANRVLVRVSGTLEDARQIAEAGRKAMNDRLSHIAERAFEGLRQQPHFHVQQAHAQIDDLMEYQYVAVEEGGAAGESYARARSEAERLIGARKNTKQWAQPSWSKLDVPKSSLDGMRESVLDEALYERSSDGRTRTPAVDARARRTKYGVHGSERLCGVGLLKRLGRPVDSSGQAGERVRFMSTSHVAARPWMAGVLADTHPRQASVSAAFKALERAVGEDLIRDELWIDDRFKQPLFGRIDGAILYPGRVDALLKDDGASDSAREQVRHALTKLLREAHRGEPIPYYALLQADGDRMGRVIDHQTTFAAHRNLSIALRDFAGHADEIVNDHGGSTIYAGGDDVLALLPLHTALGCADTLRRDFAQRMGRWKDEEGVAPTLSVGLAICHHIDPMSHAREIAKRAERKAKESRNALCVIVDKRGGAETEVFGSWDHIVELLEYLVGLHLEGAISAKAGHELSELSQLLRGKLEKKARDDLREVQAADAMRVLLRKRKQGGDELADAQAIKTLRGHIEEGRYRPDQLGDALYVARLIAQAQTMAAPPKIESAASEVGS
jgi:CRISPR-associated protein Cmr2